jgi:hypothetical protein
MPTDPRPKSHGVPGEREYGSGSARGRRLRFLSSDGTITSPCWRLPGCAPVGLRRGNFPLGGKLEARAGIGLNPTIQTEGENTVPSVAQGEFSLTGVYPA